MSSLRWSSTKYLRTKRMDVKVKEKERLMAY